MHKYLLRNFDYTHGVPKRNRKNVSANSCSGRAQQTNRSSASIVECIGYILVLNRRTRAQDAKAREFQRPSGRGKKNNNRRRPGMTVVVVDHQL